MKKNGFVFVESLVVLMVVALSLVMLLSSYSLIQRKTKEKEYYDRSSDKYLLYSISNLGTDSLCSYSVKCTGETTINFRADRDALTKDGTDNPNYCKNTKLGNILYSCDVLLDKMQIRSIYVVDDIKKELKSSSAVNTYDNGVIEYMKTLKKCNDVNTSKTAVDLNADCSNPISYMIGVFERGNNNLYYAAINLSGNAKNQIPSMPEGETKQGWYCENCNNSPKPALRNQIWRYYENNIMLKGLHKIVVTTENSNKYYYYFNNYGEMSMGWVYYDSSYHLFSAIDKDSDGNVDGRRIQSANDNRLKVTINNSKVFYVDKLGSCYTCESGNCACNGSDVNEIVTDIKLEYWEDYTCNGDECYGG